MLTGGPGWFFSQATDRLLAVREAAAGGHRWALILERCRAAGVRLALLSLALSLVAAPARAANDVAADPLFDEEEGTTLPGADYSDPLESVNRSTHAFNSTVEEWVVDPVARSFSATVPEPAQHGMRSLLNNLDEPTNAANSLFQLEWGDAATALARFTVNSTIGLGGLLDPATGIGLEARPADFGETLADAGVDSGPYLVLPLAGPTNARDGTGIVVDFLLRPTTWILGPTELIAWTMIHGSTTGVVVKGEHLEEIDALKGSSIDYYAALRSAHRQVRAAELAAREPAPVSSTD